MICTHAIDEPLPATINGFAVCDDCADSNNTLHIHDCLACGEPTGFATDQRGTCDACTPHICTPELPEDDWCDYCGKDI